LLTSFRSALENVDGTVHSVQSDTEVPALVGWILGGAGARSFLSWGPDRLPVGGVVEHLVEEGMTRAASLVPNDAAMRLTHQRAYADVDAGITGAQAGFAESGSIVLAAAPGQPRMASLIPPLHVALLRRNDMYPSLSAWAGRNPTAASDTANLVFITGPSRTGDIEMHLTLGVHGPREIHVILC
jgi:L-lactate dehydrogenase complex protein LldG